MLLFAIIYCCLLLLRAALQSYLQPFATVRYDFLPFILSSSSLSFAAMRLPLSITMCFYLLPFAVICGYLLQVASVCRFLQMFADVCPCRLPFGAVCCSPRPFAVVCCCLLLLFVAVCDLLLLFAAVS